jgi:uncharacterized protein (DUF736 family)
MCRRSGFTGRIQTLFVTQDLSLVPENPPMPRMRRLSRHFGDGEVPEIGVGRKRTGEKAGEYVSPLIDDTMLTQLIRANLFRSTDDHATWVLNGNRPPKRGERDWAHAAHGSFARRRDDARPADRPVHAQAASPPSR